MQIPLADLPGSCVEEGHDEMDYKEEAEEEEDIRRHLQDQLLEDPRACCGCVRARWRESAARDLKKNLRRIFSRTNASCPGGRNGIVALRTPQPSGLY